jgi:hypothetical protein
MIVDEGDHGVSGIKEALLCYELEAISAERLQLRLPPNLPELFYLPPPRVVLELLDQILDPSGEVKVLQLDPEVYKRVRSSVERFFAC